MHYSFKKYWPGGPKEHAFPIVQKLNSKGIKGSLSLLPIKAESPKKVKGVVEEYKTLYDSIEKNNLQSDTTIKLHQLGCYIDKQLARESTEQVVEYAKKKGNFLWIDMELPQTIDQTLDIFKEMNKKYGNVGVCMQAYLERTEDDMNELLRQGAPIRLVKGFYRDHDIQPWERVTENYEALMIKVLRRSRKPAIATHDLSMIHKAKEIIKKKKLKNAEIQHFFGVRNKLAERSVQEGYNVRIYVPYGNPWGFFFEGLNTFDFWRQVRRATGFKP
ncbi:hypothetical protein EXS74_00795 [Candidatus Woesearchaeota archaeon]|nr:hypothetical protein [Candidatus Woesearchaeota archaeon]